VLLQAGVRLFRVNIIFAPSSMMDGVSKNFMGERKRGNLTGEDILEILLAQKQLPFS